MIDARPGRPAARVGNSTADASLLPSREFHFTADDFEKVRKLIYQHAGISLAPVKQDMVYSRLARRLRANNYTTFAQYLAHLERNDEAEWETFINSLTTNLTSFFREAHHFEILSEQRLVRTLREIHLLQPALSARASARPEQPRRGHSS